MPPKGKGKTKKLAELDAEDNAIRLELLRESVEAARANHTVPPLPLPRRSPRRSSPPSADPRPPPPPPPLDVSADPAPADPHPPASTAIYKRRAQVRAPLPPQEPLTMQPPPQPPLTVQPPPQPSQVTRSRACPPPPQPPLTVQPPPQPSRVTRSGACPPPPQPPLTVQPPPQPSRVTRSGACPPPPQPSRVTRSRACPPPPQPSRVTRSGACPPPPPPLFQTPSGPAGSTLPSLHQTQSGPADPSPPLIEEEDYLSRPSQSSAASSVTTASSNPRSIRCQELETTDTPLKRKRGVVVGAKTQYMVRVGGGKIKVEYSDFHKGPANPEIRSMISRDIGSCVRDKVPMEAPTYKELDRRHKRIVYNYLSAHYDLPLNHVGLFSYITSSTIERYKQWKSDCRRHWLKWKEEIPAEFTHRPQQWEWLCSHFENPEHMALCEKVKQIRHAPRKINHHSGTTAFSYRAKKHEENGEPTPLVKAFGDAYAANVEGLVLVDAMNAKVLELIDEQPGDECTTFPIETQLSVMEAVVGQKRGTAISGVGRCLQRSPKKRGGARSSAADIILEEQVKKAQEDAQRAREESQAQSERIRRLEETIASLIANQHVTAASNEIRDEEVSQDGEHLDEHLDLGDFPEFLYGNDGSNAAGDDIQAAEDDDVEADDVEADDVEAADVDEVEGTDDQ